MSQHNHQKKYMVEGGDLNSFQDIRPSLRLKTSSYEPQLLHKFGDFWPYCSGQDFALYQKNIFFHFVIFLISIHH